MSDEYEQMRQMAQAMNGSPQARALGLETVGFDETGATMRLPYRPEIVGDPETGIVAGGAVTTLLDHVCGHAVHAEMKGFTTIATLDLRIDYMRPAKPGKDIFAKAHCYKATKSVAFVRAVAYDDDPDDPVAAVQAAFMLDSSAGRGFGANLKAATRKGAPK
ncbi:MAG: thioesterase [Caulobacter sp.]|nr:thioesterase [Caulobacter sp.]